MDLRNGTIVKDFFGSFLRITFGKGMHLSSELYEEHEGSENSINRFSDLLMEYPSGYGDLENTGLVSILHTFSGTTKALFIY